MSQEILEVVENNHSRSTRRSRIDTFRDILKAVGAGAEKPTHIMYKANLSWTVLRRNLKFLEDQGLLVVNSVNQKQSYHLSPKGLELLRQFDSLMETLNLEKTA